MLYRYMYMYVYAYACERGYIGLCRVTASGAVLINSDRWVSTDTSTELMQATMRVRAKVCRASKQFGAGSSDPTPISQPATATLRLYHPPQLRPGFDPGEALEVSGLHPILFVQSEPSERTEQANVHEML